MQLEQGEPEPRRGGPEAAPHPPGAEGEPLPRRLVGQARPDVGAVPRSPELTARSVTGGSVFNEIWVKTSPQTVPRARRPRWRPSSTGTPPPVRTPWRGPSPRPGPGKAPSP